MPTCTVRVAVELGQNIAHGTHRDWPISTTPLSRIPTVERLWKFTKVDLHSATEHLAPPRLALIMNPLTVTVQNRAVLPQSSVL